MCLYLVYSFERKAIRMNNRKSQLLGGGLRAGPSPTRAGYGNPEGKGNGSPMRVFPLALWHEGPRPREVVPLEKSGL